MEPPQTCDPLHTKEGVTHVPQFYLPLSVIAIESSADHQDDDQQPLHDQQVGVSPLTFSSLPHNPEYIS